MLEHSLVGHRHRDLAARSIFAGRSLVARRSGSTFELKIIKFDFFRYSAFFGKLEGEGVGVMKIWSIFFQPSFFKNSLVY